MNLLDIQTEFPSKMPGRRLQSMSKSVVFSNVHSIIQIQKKTILIGSLHRKNSGHE